VAEHGVWSLISFGALAKMRQLWKEKEKMKKKKKKNW